MRAPFLADLRADLRVDFRALFLADVRAPFLAPFRADFFAPRDLLVDFLAVVFLALFLLGREGRARVSEGSLKSSNAEGLEVGAGAGVFSIGSGSIQPEPDQPISM
ncbi:MAG: hypothetical protein ACREMZ_05695 [Gemmatimonadales bacterium]